MPEIRSRHQFVQAKQQIVRWGHISKQVDRLVESYGAERSDSVAASISSHIERLELAVDKYEKTLNSPPIDCLKALSQVPEYLSEARMHLRWSQAELGKRVGLSNQAISKYESSNYHGVRFGIVIRIAKVIDAALEELEERRHQSFSALDQRRTKSSFETNNVINN
jgi:DNA-binding XRE family transcriptional regulator